MARLSIYSALNLVIFSLLSVAEIPPTIDVVAAKAALERANTAASSARGEANAKQALLQTQTDNVAKARLDVTAAESLLNVKKVAHRNLVDGNAKLANDRASAATKIQTNEVERQNQRAKIDSLTAQLDGTPGVKGASAAAIDAKTKHDAASVSVTDQRNLIRELGEDLSATQKKAIANTQALQTANQNLVASGSELDSFADQKSQLEAQETAYSDEREGLKERLIRLQENVVALEKQRDVAQAAAEKAQLARDRLAGEIDTARQTKETQEAAQKDASQRLAKETKKSNDLEREVEAVKRSKEAETAKLEDLDLDKQRIAETLETLRTAATELKGQVDALKTEIANVRSLLKDATDKEPLEQRLKDLQDELAPIAQQLQEKNQKIQSLRAEQDELPAKRVEIKKKENELSRQLTEKQSVLLQLVGIIAAIAKEEQEAKKAADLAQKDFDRKTAQLPAAEDLLKNSTGAYRELMRRTELAVAELMQLRNRRPYLDKLVNTITAAVRLLENEAIPNVERDIAAYRAEKRNLEMDEQALREEDRRLTREKSAAETRLTELERQLSNRQAELRDAEKVVGTLRADRQAAEQRVQGLAAENQALAQAIKQYDDTLTKQAESLKLLSAEVAQLNTSYEEKLKGLAAAELMEKVAKANFEPLDKIASVAEGEVEKAKANLIAVSQAFDQGLKVAIEKGRNDAAQPGSDEGKAGTARGIVKGAEAGVFSRAASVAKDLLLQDTLTSGILETAAQKAERTANAALNSSFQLGQSRGLTEGKAAGLKVGDSPEVQKRGYDLGFAAGMQRMEREQEAALAKPSEIAREEEIRKDDPPAFGVTKEKRDAEQEPVALLNPGQGKLSRWLATIWRSLFEVTEALAEPAAGEISDSEIPPVQYTNRKYLDSGLQHPTYVQEYQSAYNKRYQEAYLSSFKDAYRRGYQDTLAKTLAGDKSFDTTPYEAQRKQGELAGRQFGLFEGLGFNAGRAEGFPVGKAEGEKMALDRGRAEGDPKGYESNREAAKARAIKIGRDAADARYRANVKLLYKASLQQLVDANGDKNFEINEKFAVNGVLRNLGGKTADSGSVVLQVDAASIRGVKLNRTTIPLGIVGADTEIEFSNLFTGVVLPDSEMSFTAKVLLDGTAVEQITVRQAIYAPYDVFLRDYYNANATLRVDGVTGTSGIYNAIYVKSKGDKALLNDLRVKLIPQDPTLIRFSWDAEKSGPPLKPTDFVPLDRDDVPGFKRRGFFLYAMKEAGLKTNKVRVQLVNKAGQMVFDKVVEAPVEVRK